MEEEKSGVGIVQAVAGGGEQDADKQADSHSQLGRRIRSLRGGQKGLDYACWNQLLIPGLSSGSEKSIRAILTC
jgi:hypothetical protein